MTAQTKGVDARRVLEEVEFTLSLPDNNTPNDAFDIADVREARAAVAELIEAAAKVLALPEARKELEYLRKGIGTATPAKAWLELQQSLARCCGAQ